MKPSEYPSEHIERTAIALKAWLSANEIAHISLPLAEDIVMVVLETLYYFENFKNALDRRA